MTTKLGLEHLGNRTLAELMMWLGEQLAYRDSSVVTKYDVYAGFKVIDAFLDSKISESTAIEEARN